MATDKRFQLKKVNICFEKKIKKIGCIQTKLGIFFQCALQCILEKKPLE